MRLRRFLMIAAVAAMVSACGGTAATTAPSAAAPSAAAPSEAAPSASGSASGDTIKLGLITKFPVDFFFTIENAAKDWAAQHPDVELITGQGKAGDDHEGQIAIIESMVAQGVQGIAVTPTGPQVQPALDKAVEAGVKVVLIDNDLPDWTAKTAVVATDNHAGGVLAGEWLKGVLKDGDTIGDPRRRRRRAGARRPRQGHDRGTRGPQRQRRPAAADRLRPGQGCRGSRGDPHGSTPTSRRSTAHAARRSSARSRPSRTPAIDPSAITVVGFDASPDEIAAIEAGTEDASVAQFPAKMGELGVETAWKAVKGETVEPNVDTGTAIVTSDNAAEFK